ncbi:hypothetical protein QFC24_006167 [Naganishia onofrii]|uniref:Uncharacterized protein n=1 Tax=Naganishia onofrii TaxID=1851511 RepID=A0ACC2X5A5_9TREE|nr:hypothetical protein QFC24_006167 [Naganishia onofrii]
MASPLSTSQGNQGQLDKTPENRLVKADAVVLPVKKLPLRYPPKQPGAAKKEDDALSMRTEASGDTGAGTDFRKILTTPSVQTAFWCSKTGLDIQSADYTESELPSGSPNDADKETTETLSAVWSDGKNTQ